MKTSQYCNYNPHLTCQEVNTTEKANTRQTHENNITSLRQHPNRSTSPISTLDSFAPLQQRQTYPVHYEHTHFLKYLLVISFIATSAIATSAMAVLPFPEAQASSGKLYELHTTDLERTLRKKRVQQIKQAIHKEIEQILIDMEKDESTDEESPLHEKGMAQNPHRKNKEIK